VITRFHCLHPGGRALGDEEWLRHRLPLFEKFCVASITRQTNTNFVWMVLYSDQSPPWVEKYLKSLPIPQLQPIRLTAPATAEVLRQHVLPLIEKRHVATTRFDSDDALAHDFVERVSKFGCAQSPVVLNFNRGLRLTENGLLAARDRSNPFITLIEAASHAALSTVYFRPNYEMGTYFPVVEMEGHAAWMQVIHDRNIANVPAGLPVFSKSYRDNFPGLDMQPNWKLATYWRTVRPDRVARRRLRHAFNMAR